MKIVYVVLTLVTSSAVTVHAQTQSPSPSPPPASSQSPVTSQTEKETAPQSLPAEKPDNPIPVIPNTQDGPMPCPSGTGRPCALLGGRLYFRDPIYMTEHDLTWGKAARNPALVVADVLNLAATVADVEGTESCLRAHVCREQNLLFGHNPGRARAYGTVIPIDLGLYAMAAWFKKQGQGNLAFATLWGTTMAHTYFAVEGFAITRDKAAANPALANRQKFAIEIRF